MFKLLKKIMNWFKDMIVKADKSISNIERDSKYAVREANKRIYDFKEKVATLMYQNRRLEEDVIKKEKEISKWQNLANKAVDSGNREDAKKCLEQKNKAKEELESLNKQLKSNKACIDSSKQSIETLQSDLQDKERLVAQLATRKAAVDIRKDIVDAKNNVESSDPFSELDQMKTDVEQEEMKLDAMEELSTNSEENLVAKYDSDSSVEDELNSMFKSRRE